MKLIFLILIFVSCGNDDFKSQSKLNELRVLAITADTPEINSAGTVTLTPLISYIDGAGVSLDYEWEACPDPGIDFGADLNCDSALSSLRLSGSGNFNTSGLAGTYYTGNATTLSVNIPTAAFTYLSALDSDIQYNGLDYIVFLKYTDSTNNKELMSIKRIKLSTKSGAQLNTNPTFTSIQFNNGTLSSYPTSSGVMTIIGASNPETYDLETNIGLKSFSENLYISWFSNEGEFLFNRTDIDENNEYDPSSAAGGVFVAILRDGRGGVATQVVSY